MEFWGDLFSGQYGLQWDAAKTDDTLTLPFSVPKAGRYRIDRSALPHRARRTFRLALDDQPATEPVNLYQPPPFPGAF